MWELRINLERYGMRDIKIIGFDHGWSMMKTINRVFVTGLLCFH